LRTITTDQIETALGRVKTRLQNYVWLERKVMQCDVTADETFQRSFNHFYRVRRGAEWRAHYFGLLESAKTTGIDFPEAFTTLKKATGRIEASFASKLVATLDPSKPVIDKFVLECFEMKLPQRGAHRLTETIDLYDTLCDEYCLFLDSRTGRDIRRLFDAEYPDADISELKKIDLVLWQIRPVEVFV
jgi:hypothetical protein